MGVYHDEDELFSSTFIGYIFFDNKKMTVEVVPDITTGHPHFRILNMKDSLSFATSIRIDKPEYNLYGVFKDRLNEEQRSQLVKFLDSDSSDYARDFCTNYRVIRSSWDTWIALLDLGNEYQIGESTAKPDYSKLPTI